MTRSYATRLAAALQAAAVDKRGSTMIIFALLAAPMCGAIALGVDYSRATNLRAALHNSADAAALAAVIAAANGASDSDATDIANASWQANASRLSNASTTILAPSIALTTFNGVATANVSYSGSQATTFGKTFGVPAIAVSGSSEAQSYKSTTAKNGVGGSGSVWGDPHVSGADGNTFTIKCPTTNWYDLLSDSGVEVNFACFHSTYYNEDMVDNFSVVLGSHVVGFSRPALNDSLNPVSSFNAGVFTLDGVTQNVSLGSTDSFLAGQVTYQHASDSWSNSYDNVMTIKTPVYSISISYGANGGLIDIKAAGAGLCGLPGGAWGQTLAGIDDPNSADYQVTGPTATEYPFPRAACVTGTLTAHLLK